jgi:capsular exopolysaccharide synthesis family protein
VERAANRTNQKSEVDELKKFLSKILAKWHWIVLSLAAALTVAWLVNRYTTPIYSVYTTILSKKYYKPRSSSTMDVIQGSEYFATQKDINWEVSVLKSYRMVSETIKRLDWDVFYYQEGNLRTSELYPCYYMKVKTDTSSTDIPYNVLIDCEAVTENSFRLSTENETWQERMPTGTLQFDQPYQLDGWNFRIESGNGLKPGMTVSFKFNHRENLIARYRGKLQVGWLAKGSAVLKLSLTGETPKREIDFLTELAKVIDQQSIISKNEAAVKTIDFINEQLEQLSDSLVSTSKVMQRYKLQNRELTLGSQNIFQRINALEEEKYQLQLTNHYLDYLDEYINSKSEHDVIAPNTIGVEASLLNNLIIEYVNLRMGERTRNTALYKNSPLYKYQNLEVEDRLREYEQNILESIQTSRERNNFNISKINERINNYLAQMGTLLDQERELTDYKKIFNLNEQFYVMLLTEKVTASIAKASQESDYAVLDSPRRSGPPISPRENRNFTYAVVIGLGLPIGLIYLIAFLNPLIITKDDLDNHTTMPMLGMVGRLKNGEALVVNAKPQSSLAEAFRNLRANLHYFLNGSAGGRTILISSTVGGEGKTFCSANLAYVYAIAGKKTLILGADMRKPALAALFKQKKSRGLSSYLAGMCEYEELGENVVNDNLFIIHSGHAPPNPSELLVSGKMPLLMQKIKDEYDIIIIDCPPIGIVSDALELVKYADINAIVVRQGVTKKHNLDIVNAMHEEGKLKNSVSIFNDVDFSRMMYGYQYAYNGQFGYGYYDDEPDEKRNFLKRVFKKKS